MSSASPSSPEAQTRRQPLTFLRRSPRRRAPLRETQALPEATPLSRRRALIGPFEMRRARAHLVPELLLQAFLSATPELPSAGAPGRSLRPAVLASPPDRVRRPACTSGQRGACCHEASVSTGPRSRGRRLLPPRPASPAAAVGLGTRRRYRASRLPGRGPQSGREPPSGPPRGGRARRARLRRPRPAPRRPESGARLAALASLGQEMSAPSWEEGEVWAATPVRVSQVALHLAPGPPPQPFLKFPFPSPAARTHGLYFAELVRAGGRLMGAPSVVSWSWGWVGGLSPRRAPASERTA